ncbi:tRNA (adenine(22)-N(1))-methyltransferase [Paenibacillus sp. MMS18-CY102]|uniref:tRNA (adenine(22)-N(1))-methyltransferase n=1 Tax=Paenibacillus sp. MMS18-CY102 TaxID=2682849 RepID=UPI001365AF5A|nr:class I SAM-dependent methyltransferase [Paenibacillus sp. MMS18-CY102]MWC27479.1 tRNA (adenine-N(1))-methyltransferase [Paenibacillus sp. MMS18-CY102]
MSVNVKLSERLETIASLVTAGARVADIGSDHALLPVYLVSTGKCPSAIAGELNLGPFEAASKQVREAKLAQLINVRRGNGMAVLTPGEADTVTIAGMGGQLIATILEEGRVQGNLEGVKELVLQPNVGEDTVRYWLSEHHWLLVEERILEEDGKIYEILRAVRADGTRAAEQLAQIYNPALLPLAIGADEAVGLLYRFGPWLIQQPSDVLVCKWESEWRKLERICVQMEQSGNADAVAKAVEFRNDMKRMEEVLACLRKDKR